MLTHPEREIALKKMKDASDKFYAEAIRINNHPFLEFTGLLNEYIKACEQAHQENIDFSECNTHSQNHLPLEEHQVQYINEKLECIFTGRSIIQASKTETPPSQKSSLETSILEAAKELCPDYPIQETTTSHEAFYALEASLRGSQSANKKLHATIQVLRKKLGLSNTEIADIIQACAT